MGELLDFVVSLCCVVCLPPPSKNDIAIYVYERRLSTKIQPNTSINDTLTNYPQNI